MTLLHFEAAKPNGAVTLANEFNILNYGNLSFADDISHLVDQYDQRDNRLLPYGLVAFRRTCHNNGVWETFTILSNLKRELGDKFLVRVVEIESSRQLGAAINRAKRRYGPDGRDGHKIAFGIVSAHGSPNLMQWGDNNSEGIFSIDNTFFQNDTLQGQVQDCFVDNPTIIFASCSTGRDGGIAEKVAQALHATTLAPASESKRPQIKTEIDNGKVHFSVVYPEGVTTKMHTS